MHTFKKLPMQAPKMKATMLTGRVGVMSVRFSGFTAGTGHAANRHGTMARDHYSHRRKPPEIYSLTLLKRTRVPLSKKN